MLKTYTLIGLLLTSLLFYSNHKGWVFGAGSSESKGGTWGLFGGSGGHYHK